MMTKSHTKTIVALARPKARIWSLVLLLGSVSSILPLLASTTANHHAHVHPHNQFQQAQNGHLHDSTHSSGSQPHPPQTQTTQQFQQQHQQQQPIGAAPSSLTPPPLAPQQQPPSSSSSLGGGAGKIIAPLAAGALMGAALQQQNRPTRHLGGDVADDEHDERVLIDLSHPLHNGTLHWPKFKDFQYTILHEGEKKDPRGGSYFLKADSISTALHSGTHLDAPLHFSKSGWPVDKIPLQRLIDVPVSVVDVSDKVAANRSYNFVKSDFINAKTNASLVKPKSVVLVYTGLSELYDQGAKAYLGTDTRNISEMKIPGFSGEAAQYLVEQGVYGVGTDSPSADSSERHGADESYDPVAHVILNSNNIYILENVSAKLKELVNASAVRLTIAPLPIVDGSGSPVRLVAIVGHDECHCHAAAHNSAHNNHHHQEHSILSVIITLFLCMIVILI